MSQAVSENAEEPEVNREDGEAKQEGEEVRIFVSADEEEKQLCENPDAEEERKKHRFF